MQHQLHCCLFLTLCGICFLLAPPTAGAAPGEVCIQGLLQDHNGGALSGERTWRLQFHGDPVFQAPESTILETNLEERK